MSLMTDIAAAIRDKFNSITNLIGTKADKSTTIITTDGLTIDGGTSGDLSASRTIALPQRLHAIQGKLIVDMNQAIENGTYITDPVTINMPAELAGNYTRVHVRNLNQNWVSQKIDAIDGNSPVFWMRKGFDLTGVLTWHPWRLIGVTTPEPDNFPLYDAAGRLKSGAAPVADNDVVRRVDLPGGIFNLSAYGPYKYMGTDVAGVAGVYSMPGPFRTDGFAVIQPVKTHGTISPSSQGGMLSIAHNVTGFILFMSAVISTGTINAVPGMTSTPGCQYDAYIDGSNLIVKLHDTNSGSILSKQIIFYIIHT